MPESLFCRPALIVVLLVPLATAAFAVAVSPVETDVITDSEYLTRLNANRRLAYERMDRKGKYIDDLIAGRSTLRETVARFKFVHDEDKALWQAIRQTVPDQSESEWLARNVLTHVRSKLEDNPNAAEQLKQFERELAAYLAEVE
jgi:hypothetical protein